MAPTVHLLLFHSISNIGGCSCEIINQDSKPQKGIADGTAVRGEACHYELGSMIHCNTMEDCNMTSHIHTATIKANPIDLKCTHELLKQNDVNTEMHLLPFLF